MAAPSLSAFFPCYNDVKTIGKLVKNVDQVLQKLTTNYEVIVVEDGSTDGSLLLLKKLQKKYKKLRLIVHKKNKGYGGALVSGFKAATKKLVFYTDGDGQYNVKELPILLKLMTSDVDFVNGIKMARQDASYRILVGNFYSLVIRWGFWLPIIDVDCDFRLIRRSILKKFKLTSMSGSICVELVKKAQQAGARFRQVSVHHYSRKWGESQFFVPRRILKTFWDLANLWLQLIARNLFKKAK
jgi:glycosyltransferase involved in cell wall biosynthesis